MGNTADMSFIIRRQASTVAAAANAAKSVGKSASGGGPEDKVLKKGARRDPELYILAAVIRAPLVSLASTSAASLRLLPRKPKSPWPIALCLGKSTTTMKTTTSISNPNTIRKATAARPQRTHRALLTQS